MQEVFPSSLPHTSDYTTELPEHIISCRGKPSSPQGNLHLTPCSIEDFAALPNGREGRYQLLDGILHFQPYMVDKKHILIQDFLKCMIQLWVVANLHKSFWVSVYCEAQVVKASREDPLREGGKEPDSGLIADLAVGPYHTVSDERQLSNICFPSGTVPKLVIEVTSRSNLLTDLLGKAIDYARIEVPLYVIVDRENERVRVYYLKKPVTSASRASGSTDRSAKSNRRTSARIADAKPPSGYPMYKHWRDFRGSEVVDAVYLKEMGMSAKDMLNPPCNGSDIHFSNVKRARKEKKKAKRANLYASILEDALNKRGIPIPQEALNLKELPDEISSSSVPSTPSTPSPSSSPPRQKPRKS